jgi:hypothetical protein
MNFPRAERLDMRAVVVRCQRLVWAAAPVDSVTYRYR